MSLAAIVSDHAHVGVEHWGSLVDLDRGLEKLRGLVEFLLLETYVAKSPPCVVVSLVSRESSLIAFLGRIEVFISDILMPTEGVRICKVSIELDST